MSKHHIKDDRHISLSSTRHRLDVTHKRRRTNKAICEVCGGLITAHRCDVRTCGPTCRQQLRRSTPEERAMYRAILGLQNGVDFTAVLNRVPHLHERTS